MPKVRNRLIGVLWGMGIMVSGCATAPVAEPPVVQNSIRPQWILAHGDGRVGTYVSSDDGFSTSSYWIEGPTGLILIDTQFLLSAGNEAVEWAERVTGKKVQLAIILHPNPDKFNGTADLQKRGVKVVTSQQVADLIPLVHKDRHYWFYDRYKPDYPNETPVPESFGSKTIELTAGGVAVTAHVLKGPGCSQAHVVVEFQHHVFAGDLITSLNHSWLEIGEIDEWLKRLQEIRDLEPEFVHPGRGPSGGIEVLDRQELYLRRVRELVLKEKPKYPMDGRVISKIQEQLLKEYPGYGNEYFLEAGLPSVWEHYVTQGKAAKH